MPLLGVSVLAQIPLVCADPELGSVSDVSDLLVRSFLCFGLLQLR